MGSNGTMRTELLISLLYVSSTRIEAQLLFDIEGNITVKVITANGSTETSVNPGCSFPLPTSRVRRLTLNCRY